MVEVLFLAICIVVIYKICHSKDEDYCTCFPDGDWGSCCWKHDHDCILALEYLSPKMRAEADIALYRCVKYNKKRPVVAAIMYVGVRLWACTGWWLNYFLMKYYGRYI